MYKCTYIQCYITRQLDNRKPPKSPRGLRIFGDFYRTIVASGSQLTQEKFEWTARDYKLVFTACCDCDKDKFFFLD